MRLRQFRFPASKKRRIRTKWEKSDSNYRMMPDQNMYVEKEMGFIAMHPDLWRKLERAVVRANLTVDTTSPPWYPMSLKNGSP